MNKFIPFATFVLGSAIGSLATWKYWKNYYKNISDEDIKSMKEVIYRKTEVSDEMKNEVRKVRPDLKPNKSSEALSVKDYATILSKEGYTNYAEAAKEAKEEELQDDFQLEFPDPYVISPDEAGALDDYDLISISYYADGVLADDADLPVKDVESLVGEESLTHFGEYEDDCVWVRNERLGVDFEILLDQRTYAEVLERNPYKAGSND